MKIVTVLGTRPEIIKLSPLIEAFDENFNHTVIHTGQHYDPAMDKEIFKELKLTYPKVKLRSEKGDFSKQINAQINALYNAFRKLQPDYVIVQGDTNSAMTGALVAARLKIKVIHIEAGCRSGNLNSPEEQNRMIIDAISTIRFCSDSKSFHNLMIEGKKNNTYLTGSPTFDALKRSSSIARNYRNKLQFRPESYVLVTLHRAENMDDEEKFLQKIKLLNWLCNHTTVIFAIHPRTEKYLKNKKIKLDPRIVRTGPMKHLQFIGLLKDCRMVLSDSGGIQEEAAYFDRPCIVLRNETEWTRLIEAKKNFLVSTIDAKAYLLIEKLIKNDNFYKTVRGRKSPESKAGSTKKIISILKKHA